MSPTPVCARCCCCCFRQAEATKYQKVKKRKTELPRKHAPKHRPKH